ncbi:MAG: hypothetical protein J7K23_05620 [Thermoproteales archaeon]|nr:hypothetical protein [Thermoproteales archaeon]
MTTNKLQDALDSIDFAIDVLRKIARSDPKMAEELENILYHLEEAGELLFNLIEKS